MGTAELFWPATTIFVSRKSRPGVIAALAVALSLMTASAALTQAVPAPLMTSTKKNLGTFLTDSKGITVYIFDNDKVPGKSTCYGECAETWPPFLAKAGDPAPVAPLSIITRDNGSKQYAYKGKALYYYTFDVKPGDTEGHGLGNRWWVIKP